MTAIDYDDPEESGNADILYSIEKNVVEEDTGLPIFEIDSKTGLITTAVCCLDRERTPDYVIQVVAVDGGGLKGESHLLYTTKTFSEPNKQNNIMFNKQNLSPITFCHYFSLVRITLTKVF